MVREMCQQGEKRVQRGWETRPLQVEDARLNFLLSGSGEMD